MALGVTKPNIFPYPSHVLRSNRIIPDVIGHYAVSIKYLPIWSKVLQGGYLGFGLGFTGR